FGGVARSDSTPMTVRTWSARAALSNRVILERGATEPNPRRPSGVPGRRPINDGTHEQVPRPEHRAAPDAEDGPHAREIADRAAPEGDARLQQRYRVPRSRGQR